MGPLKESRSCQERQLTFFFSTILLKLAWDLQNHGMAKFLSQMSETRTHQLHLHVLMLGFFVLLSAWGEKLLKSL